MNILIVEDEKIAANKIVAALNKMALDIHILGCLESIQETVDFLRTNKPDLIFLDIELVDGSSFEIFDKVTVNCPVIFTTAYSKYAIKAFEVNSVAYLLKPITEEALQKALENYKKMQAVFSIDLLKTTLQRFQKEIHNNYKSSFLVKSGKSLIPISCEQIAYFFASDKWSYLITKANNQHLLSYTLSQLETMLDPSLFQRINRSYYVQRDSIIRLEPYMKGKVVVFLSPQTKESVVVSKKQTPLLKAWLGL